MKLKLPKFNFDFSEMDLHKSLQENLKHSCITTDFYDDDMLPFTAYIGSDYCKNDNKVKYYVYGYISTSEYYDAAFVESDTITVKTVKQFIAANKKVEKQLQTRYKTWVKENLYEK